MREAAESTAEERPRNIEIPNLRFEKSVNVEPVISLDDHHVSVMHCNPREYIPLMSAEVEAGFERIFCLKDDGRNQFWTTNQCRPLEVALDGLSTSIMRETISVLRPKTSSAHQNMEYLGFLTRDTYAHPFLCALNGCDKSTTASLMHSAISYENVLKNMNQPVFLYAIDAGCVARALQNIDTLQPVGTEMAEYVTQLAASVQHIHNAPEVPDKDKLLWISVVRLFFTAATVVLGLGHYSMLGEFISGEALNTTLSLALGGHTRSENCIDLWLLKDVYEKIAAQGDSTGRFSWVQVFDKNANLIFQSVIGDPLYSIGVDALQNTGYDN